MCLEEAEITEAEARGRLWRALLAILKAPTTEEIGNDLGEERRDMKTDLILVCGLKGGEKWKG